MIIGGTCTFNCDKSYFSLIRTRLISTVYELWYHVLSARGLVSAHEKFRIASTGLIFVDAYIGGSGNLVVGQQQTLFL